MKKLLACGTVVLAFSIAPAFAQAKTDQNFVTKAAQGGMAEVQLGKLAADKASSSDVKSFGQKMVDDHGRANDELKALAERKNLTLPAAIDAKDKATYNRLSKLSGRAFDRAYMQGMLKDHQTDIAEFQYEARSAEDPDVRDFVSKTLPMLQEHLRMAQTTNTAVEMPAPAAHAGTR